MKAFSVERSVKIFLFILLFFAINISIRAEGAFDPRVKIWATSYKYKWPSVIATGDETKVLFTCPLVCNYEHEYLDRTNLSDYTINIIHEITKNSMPTVAFLGQYDSDDQKGLDWFFETYRGYRISSTSNVIPSVSEELLDGVDVLIIDGAFDATYGGGIILSKEDKVIIDKKIENGMKLITTAALYIVWNEWGEVMDIENYSLINQDILDDWYGVGIDVGIEYHNRDSVSMSNDVLGAPYYIPYSEIKAYPYNPTLSWEVGHWFKEIYITVESQIKITPRTLNLRSKGKFTVTIVFPDGYDVTEIDPSTVSCNSAPLVEWRTDGNKFVGKFNRKDLIGVSPGESVKLTVTGKLYNGFLFEGTDYIDVL